MDSGFVRGMRKAGKLAAQTLDHVCKYVDEGVTTEELDRIAADFIKSHNALAAPLGYHGFPKSICTSPNEVLCHGVPDGTVLKDGDIVNIDVTVIVQGFHGDTSRTVRVGKVSEASNRLILAAQEAMFAGIYAIRPLGHVGDIGAATHANVTANAFKFIETIGGHGIGKTFHMDPFIPPTGKFGEGAQLRKGQCITVEPIICTTYAGFIAHDIPDSTIQYYTMKDKSWTAQFEHTVLVTDTGYEILTVP